MPFGPHVAKFLEESKSSKQEQPEEESKSSKQEQPKEESKSSKQEQLKEEETEQKTLDLLNVLHNIHGQVQPEEEDKNPYEIAKA